MSNLNTRNRFDLSLTMKVLEEETVSSNGESFKFGCLPELTIAKMVVTDVSGTDPTLDVVLQGSKDNYTWTDLATFQRMSAEGYATALLGPAQYRYYRYVSTIGGTDTPSFSYAIYLTC